MIIADFGVSAVKPSVVNPSSNAKTYFPVPGLSYAFFNRCNRSVVAF